MIRIDMVEQSSGRCDFPIDSSRIVASSGDFRPQFCYLRCRRLYPGKRYVLVVSRLSDTTKSTLSCDESTRLVLRIGAAGSCAVRATQIPRQGHDMRLVVLRGEWRFDDGSAAGSHNFGRFHNNPTFVFRLQGPRPGRLYARLRCSSRGEEGEEGYGAVAINLSLFSSLPLGARAKTSTENARTTAAAVPPTIFRKERRQRRSRDDEDEDLVESQLMRRLYSMLERSSTVTYARVRDALVEEFGSSAFEGKKKIVQRVMQRMSGVTVGTLVETSDSGTYSSAASGVTISCRDLRAGKYVLVASTFEPVERRFELEVYSDNENQVVQDVACSAGIKVVCKS